MMYNKSNNFRDMRKPSLWLVFLMTAIAFLVVSPTLAQAKPNQKYASIVIDADTGQVLSERNADKVLHPASLSKMMTLHLVFDALKSGKWTKRTKLYVSSRAESQQPSKIGVQRGHRITVDQAIRALVVKSANDVAVVVAENYAGSEYKFAQLMTKRAKELGMSRTVFRNASGLPDKRQVSSARDMTYLALSLQSTHAQYYPYFRNTAFTYKGKKFTSHNRLMKTYPGMDGLKTGYIRASGFNLVSSARRNGRALIGVVFGGKTSKSRNQHMASLLDRGFVTVRKAPRTLMVRNEQPPLPSSKPLLGQQIAALDTAIDVGGDQESGQILEIVGQGAGEILRAELANHIPAIDSSVMRGVRAKQVALDSLRSIGSRIASAKVSPVKKEALNNENIHKAGLIIRQDGKAVTRRLPSRYNEVGEWTIQVGAFTSRVKSDYALRNAQKQVPSILSNALKRNVQSRSDDGKNVFRARLTGLQKGQATQACRIINDCMVIAP